MNKENIKKEYLICEECGATAKKVEWKEYREIKKRKGLLEEDRSKICPKRAGKEIK